MIVVSHRGPIRHARTDDGELEARRGAGGVVSALAPLLAGRSETTWIAAALGDDDRDAVSAGAVRGDGFDLQLLVLDPRVHRLHNEGFSTRVLWFLNHGLFDLPRRPVFEERLHEAWEAYETVNRIFADAVVDLAHEGQPVLVQDYQLALVPRYVRAARPDLDVVHFTHTPFCGPNSIRVLPDDIATSLCGSLASGPAGFHTARWARAYTASAHEVLGPDAPIGSAFADSFGPDAEALREESRSPEVAEAQQRLDDLVGDRAVIVRSDRIDPSKNIVRGFLAFDQLLQGRPEWHGRVVFLALLNPTRESLPEYQAYRQEVEQAADRVNERWATDAWTPVLLDTRDDFTRSLAGLMRYDVLLVNPVKDGLNLVAKEGPLINQRDGVLCLSREAGAFDELAPACLSVHPFDVRQTASALHEALTMPADERAERAEQLRALAAARTPSTWLDTLLSHAR